MKKILDTLKQKWAEYILEIIAITISILGAFMLENWNEDRQKKDLENSTIDALISEFESNKITLQECLDFLKEDKMFADSIRMQIGPNKPTLSIYQMNNWIGEIGQTTRCEIYTDILEDVRSSGNLKIISSSDIRRGIGKWTSKLQELQREEDDWSREFSAEFYPYTNKWIS